MHCYRPLRDFLLNRMSFLKNDRALEKFKSFTSIVCSKFLYF